jgi:hypothetical protein
MKGTAVYGPQAEPVTSVTDVDTLVHVENS